MGAAVGNATEAARRAGYKGNDMTLGQVGAENLKKPQIREAVAARVSKDPAIATRTERQQFWTNVMQGTNGAEMKDRLKASELLGKSQADFIDRKEISGPNGGALALMSEPDLIVAAGHALERLKGDSSE